MPGRPHDTATRAGRNGIPAGQLLRVSRRLCGRPGSRLLSDGPYGIRDSPVCLFALNRAGAALIHAVNGNPPAGAWPSVILLKATIADNGLPG